MLLTFEEGNTNGCFQQYHLFYVSSVKMNTHTSVPCAGGMIKLMNPSALLANPGLMPYWMHPSLCVYYMYMQILAHYRSMYVSMYGMHITTPPSTIIVIRSCG